jgi:hypothetical protein
MGERSNQTRRRITLLVAALMVALSMSLGGLASAAFPLAEECAANGGTFDSATKTCTYPVGMSDKVKTATFHDAGNGDQTGRTNPNGKSLPN